MTKLKVRDLLFLLSIIFLAIFTGLLLDLNGEKEGFVPIINQTYKPIVRNIKNFINTKIDNITRYIKVFLKKLKLI